jgi:hypothetical protein
LKSLADEAKTLQAKISPMLSDDLHPRISDVENGLELLRKERNITSARNLRRIQPEPKSLVARVDTLDSTVESAFESQREFANGYLSLKQDFDTVLAKLEKVEGRVAQDMALRETQASYIKKLVKDVNDLETRGKTFESDLERQSSEFKGNISALHGGIEDAIRLMTALKENREEGRKLRGLRKLL